jgi:hypothetical protein
MGLLFFAGFTACARSIWKHGHIGYSLIIFLLILIIPQTLRSILFSFKSATPPDEDEMLIAMFSLVILLPFLIFMLIFAVKLRNNIFSKTGFFGGPKKDKDGTYIFDSAWEMRAKKKAAKQRAK